MTRAHASVPTVFQRRVRIYDPASGYRDVTIEVSINIGDLAYHLAKKADRNTSKVSKVQGGMISGKITG